MKKTVHVAVAVIRNSAGQILIAKRPDHLHMGGFWEFPGGKVEAGESVAAALQREIAEEVGLQIESAQPWIRIPFDYPDKQVLLDVWQVRQFSGQAEGREGQMLRWVSRLELLQHDFPPANRPIVTRLLLGERLLITGAFTSAADCLQRTTEAVSRHGIHAVMLRAHHLDAGSFQALAAQMAALCQPLGVMLLCNTPYEVPLPAHAGRHLASDQIQTGKSLAVGALLGASCHNLAQLQQAREAGADYACLSPVQATRSHPDARLMGWRAFSALAQAAGTLPVMALGGLSEADLAIARQHHAAGIAAISAWW